MDYIYIYICIYHVLLFLPKQVVILLYQHYYHILNYDNYEDL